MAGVCTITEPATKEYSLKTLFTVNGITWEQITHTVSKCGKSGVSSIQSVVSHCLEKFHPKGNRIPRWRVLNKSNICEHKPVRNILDPELCPIEIEERLVSFGIGGLGQQLFDILTQAFSSHCESLEKVQMCSLRHLRGMLLYGPPGCGKTILAKNFWKFMPAKEPLLIGAHDVIGVKNGKHMKKAKAFLKRAIRDEKKHGAKSDMYVVVLDGLIDAVARKYKSESSDDDGEKLLEKLIKLMDGEDAINNLIVIATTDRMDLVDESVLGQGRFELHVKLDYPTETQRYQILDLSTKTFREDGLLDIDVNLQVIVNETSGRSGAFLASLASKATQVIRVMMAEETPPIGPYTALLSQVRSATSSQYTSVIRQIIEEEDSNWAYEGVDADTLEGVSISGMLMMFAKLIEDN